jgi:hypothetical protein
MQSVTHPLDVVKKRYQVAGLRRPLAYGARVSPEVTATLLTCVRGIWMREGAAGFFKGLTPSLVKVRCRMHTNVYREFEITPPKRQHSGQRCLKGQAFQAYPKLQAIPATLGKQDNLPKVAGRLGCMLESVTSCAGMQAAPASAVTFAAYELFLGALTALPSRGR